MSGNEVSSRSGPTNPFRNSPEWGSAYLQIAWQQYEFHADLDLLRRHYEGMKRYVAYLGQRSKEHILDFGLGDWYDIGPNPPGKSQLTPRALTATALYFEDVTILGKAARHLGREEDARTYEKLAGDIRDAFNRAFFHPETGTYASNSQTANAMALVDGLVDRAGRQTVLDAIVKDVRDRGNALSAGDIGYRYLLRALADNGRSDVIFAMNNQSDKPGYGLQLKRGATSLTEAWDANPDSSQNHFMLGPINEWFFHDLAGIQPDAPGFSKITIKPALVGDLTSVDATYRSGYGPIRSHWTREKGRVILGITIPPNTTATVYMPSRDAASVNEGGKLASRAAGVRFVHFDNGRAIYAVGSGDYRFESNTD